MSESPYSAGSGRTLVAAGYGTDIRVWRKRLVVVDGTGPNRRERTFEAATFDFDRLIVAADNGQVTLDAIRWLTEQRTCLVHLDRAGRVLAVAGDFAGDRPALRRAQAQAATSPRGLEVARGLIADRVRGELRVVEQLGDDQAAQRLAAILAGITRAGSFARLRNLEAQAGKRYWQTWAGVPVRFDGPGSQTRVPERWRTFGTRHSPLTTSPRAAITPANALLNYAMALLEAEARLACLEVGLDPGIGVVHVDEPRRDSMALDVMEAGRSAVEAWLLRWLRERTFALRDFAETGRGVVRLTPPLASWVASMADTWRGHVGPVALWVASMLADEPMPVASRSSGFRRSGVGPRLPMRCPSCQTIREREELCDRCRAARKCQHCHSPLGKERRTDTKWCRKSCQDAYIKAGRRAHLPPVRVCACGCGAVIEDSRRPDAKWATRACGRRTIRRARREQATVK